MNSNVDTQKFRRTTSCLARLVTAAVAAAAVALPAVAHATTTPPIVPITTPPTRIATPPPTSPTYVAPVLIPRADIMSSAVNDGQNDLTLTVKVTSNVLAGFASSPSTLVGRIVVTSPPGLPQMVAQVNSAGKSETAWTIATTRVSAMAALPAGNYPILPDYTRAKFVAGGGVTFYPVPVPGPTAGAGYTAEIGPYTKEYTCGTGKVDLTADLKLTPSIDADADIGWFSLNSAHLIAGLHEVASLTASTTGPDTTPATCTKSVTLGKFTVPITIGPLVANVTFSLKADLKASLLKTESASVVQTFTGEAGVQYDGNSWSLVDDADASGPTFPTPMVTGTNSVEVGLTAEAGLSFYDVISGKLDLRAYAGVKSQAPPAPTFDLYAGVKLTYEIDLFGYDVADGTIWTHWWDLFHTPVVTTTKLPGAHWGLPNVLPGTPPSYSYQLHGDGGIGALTYRLVSGTLPIGITLSSAGLISGTPRPPITACPAPPCSSGGTPDQTFTFTVKVADTTGLSGTRQLSLKVATVLVTTSKLPDGYPGTPYSAQLAASGTVGAITWHIVSGRLPAQLIMTTAGRINGTPDSHTGTYSFVVQVTDSTGHSASAAESITINNTSL